MRERWACPDLGIEKDEGMFQPVPGTDEEFPDCPAYYLRTARMGLPAVHLIDGVTHPDQLVSTWAFEVENGSRQSDTLSAKAIELVHLRIRESRKRDKFADEKRKAKNGR